MNAFGPTLDQLPGPSVEWVAPRCYTELRFRPGGRYQAESIQ